MERRRSRISERRRKAPASGHAGTGTRVAANRAKVQIGLRPVQRCKSESIILGWRVAASGGGWREDAELKGRPETGQLAGEKSPGLRSRLIGYQVRVFWYGYGCRPEPVPGVEYLNPGPDGREPGPGRIENQSVIDSVIRHRLSHLLFNSALNSVLNAVLHSVLLSASPPFPLLASGPPVL